jgi:hypothetical protein
MGNMAKFIAACEVLLGGAFGIQNPEDSPEDSAAFADPPLEYRPRKMVHGFDKYLQDRENLDGEEGIDRALTRFVELGIGGVVANVSYDDYLRNERQWEIYRYGMEKAHELGLDLWLYDEKAYPSGSAGGIVTRANPEHVALGLACYTLDATGGDEIMFDMPLSCQGFEGAFALSADADLMPKNVITLSPNVDEWGTLSWSAPEGHWTVLYLARRVMYEGTFVTAIPHGDPHQYINLLEPEAVKAFLRTTYQSYLHRTPEDIWKNIRAIFTDEPLLLTNYFGSLPSERESKQFVLDQPFFTDRPPAVPWSRGLKERFREMHGYDLAPWLYALFTSMSRDACYVRQNYWDTVSTVYAESYFGQIADWCAENSVAMSGHVLGEEGLHGHVMFHGSLFSAIRPMQLPGIDILTADPVEIGNSHFIGAKAVSSIAHLTGRPDVHCEGCAFRALPSGEKPGLKEYIAQANMLYVMGINEMNLYLPNEQVLDEGAFRHYCDYTGRLGLMLKFGRHICEVALLYPVRSAWVYRVPHGREEGPAPQTDPLDAKVSNVAKMYLNTCRELAQNQIDFDILDERAVQEAEMKNGAMHIADEIYKIIVLPIAYALEQATVDALADFCKAGGMLIYLGDVPEMANSLAIQDAFDVTIARLFGENGPAIPLSLKNLVDRIRTDHEMDFALDKPNSGIFYTHRRREGRDIYFVANNNPKPVTLLPNLRVPGPYNLYRPLTGEIEPIGAELMLDLGSYEGIFIVSRAAQ